MTPISPLDADTVARLVPLVAIGCSSGATVIGLSAVRRTKKLAYVLLDGQVAQGTQRELAQLSRFGTQILQLPSMATVGQAFGRTDVKVVGIKRGALAQGIAAKLAAQE